MRSRALASRLPPAFAAVAFVVAVLPVFALQAHGPQSPAQAIITVDSTADALDASPGDGLCQTARGACTLRAAIQEANAGGASASIRLPAGAYRLTIAGAGEDSSATGDLDICSPIDLHGEAGRDQTVIEAAVEDRVLHVACDVLVRVAGVTIRGGKTNSHGGGILNGGTLRLENSVESASDVLVAAQREPRLPPNGEPSDLAGRVSMSPRC